jgi:hypothetical protein
MKLLATVSTLATLSVMVWAQPYRVDLPQTTQSGTQTAPAQQQTTPAAGQTTTAGQTSPAPAAPAPVTRPIPTCPNPAATVPPAQRKWKHGQAEYQDFTNAAKAANPAQRAQLFAAFAQKYPDSDYRELALVQEMAAQAQSSPASAVETAETILKTPGADADSFVRAYTLISYLMPNLLQPNDPQMTQKVDALYQASYCGNQMVQAATGLQPAQKAQSEYIYNRAAGFVALQDKNYLLAKQKLTQVIQFNAKDALAYYWLGIAQMYGSPADFNGGIFSLARASFLAPQAAAIASYFQKAYDSYHGSDDGIQDVRTAAQSNTLPPAGFKIESAQDVENAKVAAENAATRTQLEQEIPPANTFGGIEARLKRPDMAPPVWKKLKGQIIQLDGLVMSTTDNSVDIAVSPLALFEKIADVRVMVSATPSVNQGDKVSVQGTVTKYDTTPNFLLTLDKGTVKPAAGN